MLKTDAAGRIQMQPERREGLLDAVERSGLSVAKFAKLAGVKYPTFAAWAARRRQQRGLTRASTPAADPVRWLEAVAAEAKPSVATPNGSLQLHLRTRAWLELWDLKGVPLAAALLRALEPRQPPC